MDSVNIRGGIALQGQVGIQGSKNAVLPVLAATLLAEGTSVIQNCPRLADVYHMQTLLKSLGCSVTREKDRLKVNTDGMNGPRALSRDIPKEAVESMRSSIVLLGALVNRTGEVELAYPGGCVIGERPIDIHIEALKQLHVTFEEKSYGLHACTEGLKGAEIRLPFPSVGATENVLLAATGADGTTILRGAAREPEIEVLCGFLNACGADITGGGSSTILIRGKRKLRGAEFAVPGDRIVAGTYLCACLAAGGEVLLMEAPAKQMGAVKKVVKAMGALWQETDRGLYIQRGEPLRSPGRLETAPYPGFPTDMQSLFLPVLALAEGSCLVEERIFENRFHIVPELRRMGAKIKQTDPKTVVTEGTKQLHGARVQARELRGGAALVIAGAAARGETIVDGCGYIERGYENICRDMRELGVRIYGV